MRIRAAIFDLDGTVVKSDGTLVPGIARAFSRLEEKGVRIAVATNHPKARAAAMLARNGVTVAVISAPDTAGAKKPSAEICRYVARELGLTMNELIYIGDSDDTDALSAVNARVLYLCAKWSNPNAKYGLPVADPPSLVRFISRFMLSEPIWYWQIDRHDAVERPVEVKVLLPANRESHELKSVLKMGADPRFGNVSLRAFLFRRLLTAIYLDGLAANLKYWTWYPSSAGQAKPAKFGEFLDQASKIFRGAYAPNLLIRHRPAVKLAYARRRGEDPGFVDQVNTVHVNGDYRKKMRGHEILVVDDFCTEGYSFECARNLLLTAEASRVVCVGFGRYHDGYWIQTPSFDAASWDPFAPRTFTAADFAGDLVGGNIDYAAMPDMLRLVGLTA